jgi:hypothetical protein
LDLLNLIATKIKFNEPEESFSHYSDGHVLKLGAQTGNAHKHVKYHQRRGTQQYNMHSTRELKLKYSIVVQLRAV